MWKVDREQVGLPRALKGRAAVAARQRLLAFFADNGTRRSQTSAPVEQGVLEELSIKQALQKLFRNKCAFCESLGETSPYAFRPPAEAIPAARRDPHLYYSWLNIAWENLYPICAGCVPKEPAYFPVAGPRLPMPTTKQLRRYAESTSGVFYPNGLSAEKQLLLDPCQSLNLPVHFEAGLNGQLRPRTKRAVETIDHFALNRQGLVHARSTLFGHRLARLRDFVANSNNAPERAAELFDFASLEFGGSWYLVTRRIANDLAAAGEYGTIGLGLMETFFRNFSSAGAAQLKLELAIQQAILGWGGDDADQPEARRPSRSRISRVEIRNFRGIDELVIDLPASGEPVQGQSPPTPCLLILGENSTGKSSILEAMSLALGDGAALGDLGIDFAELVRDPTYAGLPPPRPQQGVVTVFDEEGASRRLSIGTPTYEITNDRAFAMTPVFAYGAFRQYRQEARRNRRSRYIRNLFHSDEPLSNPERWLLGLPDERFNEVVRCLRDMLSVEQDFDVIERDFELGSCFVVTQIPGTSDIRSRVPLCVVSSGYRAIIAMVCEIMQGLMDHRVNPQFESLKTARGVILIDEVEAHLHPRWKIAIMGGLRSALPGMTIVATSHDPLCLRGMAPGEVLVLRRVGSVGEADGDPRVRVEAMTDLPDMSLLRIDQLLTSNFFQMYSTDDHVVEEKLAQAAELAAREDELTPAHESVLRRLEEEIGAELPVGDTEVQRLVQKAVADYLIKRRASSADRLRQLSEDTRSKIGAMLERL